ncbi:MAG: hypothetical protein ACYCVG_03880 [Leptospirillum sp.]
MIRLWRQDAIQLAREAGERAMGKIFLLADTEKALDRSKSQYRKVSGIQKVLPSLRSSSGGS